MKTITFTVEITAEIPKNLDPDDVFFNVNFDTTYPMAYTLLTDEPAKVGKVIGFSTTGHHNTK